MKEALFLFFGAFLSGIVGVAVFRYERSRNARDHFLVTISQMGGLAVRQKDLLAMYDSTLQILEESVFRLRPFLKKNKASDLSVWWNLYCRCRSKLEQAHDHDSWLNDDDFYAAFDKKRPQDKQELVQWFLKKFSDIAK